ncbi:hypothetical protein T459_28794 [Capsicum annuum]|uniref:Uncharacterized protein n=1 Tax=Capsicum annuum TaxID=4072 RepID=A0A2G2YHU3_CAPAN|nr:uncharacterized protein LOC107847028 [Capsicum annuum]PHT69307.1 hypothetical protein T459_28794 [Capsicum annuum]
MSTDHPTPFPGKFQHVKSRFNKNISKAPKIQSKEPSIPRQNRVFGTVKSTNVPTKTVSGKTLSKSSSGIVLKPSKSPKKTQSLTDSAENPANESAKKATIEENRTKPSKKSVCFQENKAAVAAAEPKTPAKSPVVAKPRLSGSITPFHSAEKCSKCRFDRLETSSYWLSQIKLAETVGKHTVSAAFFRLALESKAEPYRNIRLELKRYIRRHKHLSESKEWIEVCFSYGLLKDESNSIDKIGNNSKNKSIELECTIEKEEEEEEGNEVSFSLLC